MVWQYRVNWNIPGAGPSVSTFHFADTGSPPDATVSEATSLMMGEAASFLPNDVSFAGESEFRRLNTITGEFEASVVVSPPASVSGTGAGTWAGGAGFRVRWETNVVRAGRRVRGATFFVPATASAFTNTGRVSASVSNAMASPIASYLSALQGSGIPLVIWSRPTPPPGGIGPERPGAASPVVSGTPVGLAATLRGRKY